jgi:2,3-bisphosphoglycerate-independent phosphoglycerate mutase
MNKHKNTPLVLVILDGWGESDKTEYNAIYTAKTPFFDSLKKKYPHTVIDASEEFVGLPEGQMGNSEIGHMTIGAGRVLPVDLVRINQSFRNEDFITNPVVESLFDHVKAHNSNLHVMGLISPGGVHSHRDHLYAFLKIAKSAGIQRVIIHAFTDGRDVAPTSAAGYLKELEDVLEETGVGVIATMQGRYYAMDRDKNWDRIELAIDALIRGNASRTETRKPSEVMQELYAEGIVDEMLEPVVFVDENGKSWTVEDNDGVFFLNYRPDRARQLSTKIADLRKEKNIFFATMTKYGSSIESEVVFKPEAISETLSTVLSKNGLTQVHIAETEKFAHVTYFFNGGRETLSENEKHVLIDSRKDIKTHDEAPEMKAKEITEAALEELDAGTEVLIMNYANADMVGHTANEKAIITGLETVDKCLEKLVTKVEKMGGVVIITADHGNAEHNFDVSTNTKHTAHTLNQVPFIVTKQNIELEPIGTLANITPTVLDLLGIEIPKQMEKSMIK